MKATLSVNHAGWLQQCLIVLALMLLLWYFIGTPLHLSAVLVGAGLLAVIMAWGLFITAQSGKIERETRLQFILVIAIALCLPVYSAVRANLHFGQPLLYGVLADRHWWGIVSGPVIYYLLSTGKLQVRYLVNALLALSWVSLFAFTAVAGFFLANPEAGADLFEMTAISNTEGRGLRVKFPLYAIVFGAMHYLAMAIREKPLANLLKGGLFVFYVVFVARGRVDIACLGLALTYGLFASGLYRHWKMILCVSGIYLFLGVVLTQAATKADLLHGSWYEYLFQSTASDLLEMSENRDPDEPGLKARKASFQLVVDDLLDSPALLMAGSGRVSNRWQGGFSGLMGTWFYPRELGFIGAFFVYGLGIFVALCGYSLYLGICALRRSSATEYVPLIALRWMVVFLLIQLVSGKLLLYPTPFYFTVFVCLALGKKTAVDLTALPLTSTRVPENMESSLHNSLPERG